MVTCVSKWTAEAQSLGCCSPLAFSICSACSTALSFLEAVIRTVAGLKSRAPFSDLDFAARYSCRALLQTVAFCTGIGLALACFAFHLHANVHGCITALALCEKHLGLSHGSKEFINSDTLALCEIRKVQKATLFLWRSTTL